MLNVIVVIFKGLASHHVCTLFVEWMSCVDLSWMPEPLRANTTDFVRDENNSEWTTTVLPQIHNTAIEISKFTNHSWKSPNRLR